MARAPAVRVRGGQRASGPGRTPATPSLTYRRRRAPASSSRSGDLEPPLEQIGDELFTYFADDPRHVAFPNDGRMEPAL